MTSRSSWITHFLSSIIIDWEDKPKGTCNFQSSHIKYEQGSRKTNSSSLTWQPEHDEDEQMKVEHRSSKCFKSFGKFREIRFHSVFRPHYTFPTTHNTRLQDLGTIRKKWVEKRSSSFKPWKKSTQWNPSKQAPKSVLLLIWYGPSQHEK